MAKKLTRGGRRKGAGRPKVDNPDPLVALSMKVPKSVLTTFDARAKEQGSSRPKILASLLNGG